MVLVVLGGSSPFTAELIRGMAEASVDGDELVLYGRSLEGLEAIAALATHQLAVLGWRIRIEDRLADALPGAGVIVHQIRYGALEGRVHDEALARRFALPADETLGPSGLQSALRAAPGVTQLARTINRECPAATVINLTNPLSVTTSLLRLGGVECPVGLCELPWTTLRQACRFLGKSPEQAPWRYAGLNHRGYIYELDGADGIGILVDSLAGKTIEGVRAAEIEELGAIPLKYHRLLRPGARGDVGRGTELLSLRRRLLTELRACPGEIPASLGERAMPWYPLSLVPLLVALRGGPPYRQTLNLCSPDETAWEVRVTANACGIQADWARPRCGKVGEWLDRFHTHEGAVLRAALDPGPQSVEHALALDPLLRARELKPVKMAICEHQKASDPILLA